MINPADASGMMAIGAIDYRNWATGPQEFYSSQGPTNDGRIKPDLMGPDFVSNSVYGIFAGTSAASPHVAGAAALILSRHPNYSASQLWDNLTSSAIDLGSNGKDNIYGYGLVNLDNGKVERSHRTDDVEFYQLLSYTGDVDLNRKLSIWEKFYNFTRPHTSLKGQTPYEILRKKLR